MFVAVLLNAGDQVPMIPLFDVVGRADKLPPEQIGATVVNVGVTFGLTVNETLPDEVQPKAVIDVAVNELLEVNFANTVDVICPVYAVLANASVYNPACGVHVI